MRDRRRVRNQLPRASDDADDYASAPCFFLCMDCRYLRAPSVTDPMRGGGDPALVPCPCCQGTAWVDLRHNPSVLALSDVDGFETRIDRPFLIRVGRAAVPVAIVGSLVGVLVMVWTASWAVGSMIGVYFVLLAGLLTVPAVVWATRAAVGQLRRPTRRPVAARWLAALPSASPKLTAAVRGVARPTGDPLVAPLTARKCLAYVVGVRRDGDPDGEAHTWGMWEEHHAPLQVGPQTFDADTLKVRRRPQEIHEDDVPGPRLAAFLRPRGLLASDAEVRLFEAVLTEEDVVEVAPHDGVAVLSVPADDAPKPLPPG